MENLEQLEKSIDGLLHRLGELKNEIIRLNEEVASLNREKAVLEEQNQTLHDTICKEENLRTEAMTRIDSLLRKIRDHDNVI